MRTRLLAAGRPWPLLLLLLALLLAACDNSNQAATPVKAPANKQIYTMPQTGLSDYTTLDPALSADPNATQAIEMLFTGLVQLDSQQQVQPALAQSWKVSSDGLTWTFSLKANLKFSDGTPLTAHDVAYSIDRAHQPATKSTVAPIYLSPLRDSDKLLSGTIPTLIDDSISVPDNTTITLTTKRKTPYLLSMLTNPCAFVVEKSLVTKYAGSLSDHLGEGGGAGPFKVQSYARGKEIDFVPNKYYNGPKPQLSKVILPFYGQAEEAYRAYQAGRVDTTPVPFLTFANDSKRKDFHQIPQLWINYYTMNYLVKPFDNTHIRQAFALAIDKTAIAKGPWKGTVQPTNHLIPQGMSGYNAQLTGPDGTNSLKGNATQAKALLAQGLHEENWSSISQMPPIKLTYATGLSSFDQEASAMIQMWQSVLQVTVSPNPLDYNTLLDQVTAATNNGNGLQMWGLSWIAEYPDPQNWLSLQFGRGLPNNNLNYGENVGPDAAKQQLVQKQLDTADTTMDNAARLTAYQQAEQQLVSNVAWLPMEQVSATFLRKAYVIGVKDNAQNIIYPDDWGGIYVLQH